jgi:GAF domain-containing protein
MESPGRDAIHPDVADVTALVVNRLTELRGHSGVSAEQFEILQQRTLYGSDTTSDFTLAESAGVARLHQSGKLDYLVLFLCVRRHPDGDWQLSSFTTAPLGLPPITPHIGRSLLGPIRAIFGSVVTSPEIGAVRATLPDGSQFEDPVTNSSSLLVVPLRSQAVQTGTLIVQILDRAGDEITADRLQLPYGPR